MADRWWERDALADDDDWWKADPLVDEIVGEQPEESAAEPRISRRGVAGPGPSSLTSMDPEPVDTLGPHPPLHDPFADEPFGETATRRGQQYARGLTEIAAALPETAAIAGAGGQMRSIEAGGQMRDALSADIAEIEERLQDPTLDEGTRGLLEKSLADMRRMAGTAGRFAEEEYTPPTETGLYQTGEQIREASGEFFGEPDPRDQTFWAKLAEGAGNMTGFAVSSLASGIFLGPAAGVATGAAVGAGLNSSALYREAKEAGVDDETAHEVARWGVAIGSSEIFPIARAFRMLPAGIRRSVSSPILRRFTNIAATSGEEAAQEFLAEVANNMVAKGFFDPERGWDEGVWESAGVGAVLGGIMGGMAGPGPRQERRETPGGGLGRAEPRAPVTPGDVASPLPTEEISRGKAEIDRLLGGREAPAAPETPADVPEGAVPLDTLYARPAAPETPEAPEAPVAPEIGTTPAYMPPGAPPVDFGGLGRAEPIAPTPAPEAPPAAPEVAAAPAEPAVPTEPTVPTTAPAPLPRRQRAPMDKRPASINRFLSQAGGIRPDEQGELTQINAQEWHKQPRQAGEGGFRKKLVRDEGMDIGRATEAAYEAGYIEEATEAALLDAMDRDLRGERVIARDEIAEDMEFEAAEQDRQARQAARDRVSSVLANDWSGTDLKQNEIDRIADEVVSLGVDEDTAIEHYLTREVEYAEGTRDVADEDIPFEPPEPAGARVEGATAPGPLGEPEAPRAASTPDDRGQAGEAADVAPPAPADLVRSQAFGRASDPEFKPGSAEGRAEAKRLFDADPVGYAAGRFLFDLRANPRLHKTPQNLAGNNGVPSGAEASQERFDSYPDIANAAIQSLVDEGLIEPYKRGYRAVAPEAAQPADREGWRRIGENTKGKPLFEDDRGVRAYSDRGVRVSETVPLGPGGEIDFYSMRRGREHMTAEEWEQKQDEDRARAEIEQGEQEREARKAAAPKPDLSRLEAEGFEISGETARRVQEETVGRRTPATKTFRASRRWNDKEGRWEIAVQRSTRFEGGVTAPPDKDLGRFGSVEEALEAMRNDGLERAAPEIPESEALGPARTIEVEGPEDADITEGVGALIEDFMLGNAKNRGQYESEPEIRDETEWNEKAETKPPEQIFPAPAVTIDMSKRVGEPISIEEAQARIAEWKAEAARMGREEDHSKEAIISLFDYTGNWSRPFEEAGYKVLRYDTQDSGWQDLIEFFPTGDIAGLWARGIKVRGVLSACPCTTFAASGARWWKERHDTPDKEQIRKLFGGRADQYFDTPVEVNEYLVRVTEAVVEFANPDWHVLENPIGRIQRQAGLPNPLMRFQPHHFGDPYTKRTQLWGDFNTDLPTANVEPTEGSKMQSKLRGDRDKAERSTTPEGFAYAFFMANRGATAQQTEQTPEGEQVVMPGVKPITESERQKRAIEQGQARPLTGRDTGPRSGREDLFGESEDRRDLLDQPAKPQQGGTPAKPAAAPKKAAGRPKFEGERKGDKSKLTEDERDRLAELQARFRQKIRSQLNAGLDPELVAIAVEMGYLHIKSGARRFRDLVREMMEDLGLSFEQVQPYARNAYNQVRDDLELEGQSIKGMDSAADVLAEVRKMREEAGTVTAPQPEGEPDAEPSDAQKEAGNYRKGHVKFGGREISIETARGAFRRGKSPTGERWEVQMPVDYGHWLRTKGADGDPVDVLLGPDRGSDVALIIEQQDPDTGKFDEHKTIVGVTSPEQGVRLYLASFSDGRALERIQSVRVLQAEELLDLLKADWTSSFLHKGEGLKFARDAAMGVIQHDGQVTSPDRRTRLIDGFAASLESGERFETIVEARKRVEEFTGDPYKPSMAKDLEEAIEIAVVQEARRIANSGAEPSAVFDKLVDLYNRQPNLSTRTSTSMERQAYSTPAPLAYLASRLGRMGDEHQSVYEPSAGNGMLLLEVEPQNAIAGELTEDRIDGLRRVLGERARILTGDAMEADPGKKYSRFIANPPFGKVRDETGQVRTFDLRGLEGTTTEIDHAMVAKGLDGMRSNGRAVLIVGGVKGKDADVRRKGYTGENRKFWKKLYDNYNVTEHFTADGSLYTRQGAGWPVDVVVIEGKGKSAKPYPMREAPALYSSWEALGERLDGRDSLDTRGVRGEPRIGGAPEADQAADVGAVQGVPRRPDQPTGEAGVRGGGAPVSDRGGRGEAGGVTGPGDRGRRAGVGERRPGGEVGTDRADVAGAAREGEAGPDVEPAGPRAGDARGVSRETVSRPPVEPRENREVETSYQVRYTPRSGANFAVGTLVPKNMQQAMDRSLSRKMAEDVSDIDTFVAEELGYTREEVVGKDGKPGYFSAEQVDALAMAIDNVAQGKGFVIGDQTGVGKGRFVAGMLRYAERKGMIPVFLTKDPALYGDMIRDMRDIGMGDVHQRVLPTNVELRGDKKIPLSEKEGDVLGAPTRKKMDEALDAMRAGSLPEGYSMIFTTYSQLQQVKGVDTPRMDAMRGIAPKAMFVLDESHLAGGGQKNDRQKKGEEKTPRSEFIRGLLRDSAGAVFSSATYAKNPQVMSLYGKTDLSLITDDLDTLPEVIEAGGVPLQQVIANMLVESGQYARRERSFEGVEMNLEQLATDTETAKRGAGVIRRLFELDAQVMQDVRAAYIEEAQKEGGSGLIDNAVGDAAMSSTNFSSTMHNLAAQFLLAIKVDAVVEKAIALHKAGKKPIIALSNTNSQIVKEAAEQAGVDVGQALNVPFNVIMERYLERLRRIGVKDENDNTTYIRLSDAEIRTLGGGHALEAYRDAERFVRESDLSRLPGSPIDAILDRLEDAGINADEITGRTLTLRRNVLERREASSAAKKRAMAGYNSGKLDALVINQSGSTGFSMHATNQPGNDGKPRHMIILQPEPNIDTFMQMLGRIHRTGQTKLPAYTIAVSDLAVEKRPAAVLMRKMASLNANTTASKDSAVSLDNVTDFLNKYGDRVVAEYLQENPHLQGMLQVGVSKDTIDGIAARFTGRLVSLPPDEVSRIYEHIEGAYRDYVEALNRMGQNTLEAKVLELDAKTLSSTEIQPAKDPSSPFGQAAFLEQVDVKRLGKPYSPAQVDEEVQSVLDGKTRERFASQQREEYLERYGPAAEEIEKRRANAEAKLAEAKTDKQKGAAQDAINRANGSLTMLKERMAEVERLIDMLAPGRAGLLSIAQQGEESQDFAAVSLGIDMSRLREGSISPSAIVARVAIADAGREVRVPLSKLIGDSPAYRWREIADSARGSVMRAFEEGQTESRETRQMVTGNLPAGYAKFKKGQIVFYTDDAGTLKEGIILPREFDAGKALQDQPVKMKPDEVATFLSASNYGSRVVVSDDGVLRTSSPNGQDFDILITTKGNKPYTQLRAVRDMVGDWEQRRGAKVFRKRMGRRDFVRVLDAYADNLGTVYSTTIDRNEARAITGETVPEIPDAETAERGGRGTMAARAMPPASNAQRTQIAGTLPTYRKADAAFSRPGKTLDYGAGLGLSREIGYETFEPYPQGYEPTHSDSGAIPDESYPRVVSLNVLNVVPREARDGIVREIGRILAPGGEAIITTRGRDVLTAKGEPGPEPMSVITSRDTYQKGFTRPELVEYLRETLGPGFEVERLMLGPAGARVRKISDARAARGRGTVRMDQDENAEYLYEITPEAEAKAADLRRAVQKQIRQTGMRGLRGDAAEYIFGKTDASGDWFQAQATFSKGVITVALERGVDPESVFHLVNHETVHAARSPTLWGSEYGLFRKAEWDAVVKEAMADKDLVAEIRKQYKDEPEWMIEEEAVANLYARWRDGRPVQRSLARRALDRIHSLLRAVREAFLGEGFTTAEQVLERLESGEIGRRSRGRRQRQEPTIGGAMASRARTSDERAERMREIARKLREEAEARDRVVSDAVGERVTNSVTIDTTVQSRQRSFLNTIATHPIDAAFRIPFMAIGGLDSAGRWRYGKMIRAGSRHLLREQSLGFLNPLVERVRYGMVDCYGLPEDYVERERKSATDEQLITAEGQEFLEALKAHDMSVDEAKALHAVLTEEQVAPAQWSRLAPEIITAIDRLGKEAVELGLISAESYERNKGRYLHRVYQKHEIDQGRIVGAVVNFFGGRRRQIAGDQFKGRGLFEEVAGEKIWNAVRKWVGPTRGRPQVGDKVKVLDLRSTTGTEPLDEALRPKGRLRKRVYWPAELPVPDALSAYESRGEFEVRGQKGGNLILWRDFTKDERLKMGEILDARYTLAKTYSLMARDLATGRFFRDIAQNEAWARKEKPAGAEVDPEPERRGWLKRMWVDDSVEWVKVPKSKIPKSNTYRYGQLAGMWVRASIWRDLQEQEALRTPWLWQRILTAWKVNKTARSPVVHMNNVMSNFMLMDMADVRIPDLIRGVRSLASHDAIYQEAAGAGAFGADIVTQEFRENVLQPLMDDIRKEISGRGDLEGAGRAAGERMGLADSIAFLGKFLDRLYRLAKTVDRKMVNAYQIEDQVFRMATYIRRRQQGFTVDEAAVEARDQFLNYDIRAPWINAARRSVLPFISYTYRAVPKFAATVAERPWKIAKYWAIYEALNAVAYSLAPSDWDEEEERKSLRDNETGWLWTGTQRMIRMPYLSDGNPVFLDVRRWVPAGDVFDTQGGILPAWLHVGGPPVIAAELYLNRSAFTMDEIYNPITDSGVEKVGKGVAHLYQSWMPSAPWIPGSWYQEKLIRAWQGDAMQWGSNEPYSLAEAGLSSIGIKLKPKDVEVGYLGWQIQYNKIQSELEAQGRSLGRQAARNLISEEEYEKEMGKIYRKLDHLREEQAERFPSR